MYSSCHKTGTEQLLRNTWWKNVAFLRKKQNLQQDFLLKYRKAEAIVSSEEFQDLKELTLSILRYIHEIESYEIADKVKEYKSIKTELRTFSIFF